MRFNTLFFNLILLLGLLGGASAQIFNPGGGGGSGTVSNCAAAGIPFYSATGTTVTCDTTITDNGSGVLTFGTNGQLILQPGSATVAPILFGSTAGVWWYNCNTSQICFGNGGSGPSTTILTGTIQMASGGAYKWSSTTASNGSADTTLCRQSTGVVEVGSGAACATSGGLQLSSIAMGSNLLFNATAPTISSGFGTTPSIANNNGTASFTVNVGTGGTATSGVIGLPTAPHGWDCTANDLTTTSATVFVSKQTATTTTTATIGNFNTSGTAAAWAASDILSIGCRGY